VLKVPKKDQNAELTHPNACAQQNHPSWHSKKPSSDHNKFSRQPMSSNFHRKLTQAKDNQVAGE
jgi:hypothetical protein